MDVRAWDWGYSMAIEAVMAECYLALTEQRKLGADSIDSHAER